MNTISHVDREMLQRRWTNTDGWGRQYPVGRVVINYLGDCGTVFSQAVRYQPGWIYQIGTTLIRNIFQGIIASDDCKC